MQKSKFEQNRYSGPGMHSVRSQKNSNFSLMKLQAMNKKMEGQSKQAISFLKQLKKERQLQQKSSKIVGQGIVKVEYNGKYYASRLEQEKRKHKNLTELVKHYQEMLYEDKMTRYQEEKSQIKRIVSDRKLIDQCDHDSSQTISRERELAQLTAKLKQQQRIYEDLILKSNTSSYELSKKMDQVRVLRSERTVCSGLFDQFERQIFQHELLYKKLVIQRTVLDSIFKQKVADFIKLQQQTQKHCAKLIMNNQKMMLYQKKKMLTFESEGEELPNQPCE